MRSRVVEVDSERLADQDGSGETERDATNRVLVTRGHRLGEPSGAEGHGADAVEERAFGPASSGGLGVKMMGGPVPGELCVAPGHIAVDVDFPGSEWAGTCRVGKVVSGWGFSGVRAPDPEPHRAPELLGHHLVPSARCHVAQRDDRVGTLFGACRTTLDPRQQQFTRPDRTVDDEVVVTLDGADRPRLELSWDELSSTRFLRVPEQHDHRDGWCGSSSSCASERCPGRLGEFFEQLGVEAAFKGTDSPSELHTTPQHVLHLSTIRRGIDEWREATDSLTPPDETIIRPAQAGVGVPGGSGYTGFFFGSMDAKHTKTFFPWFNVGRYWSPTTLI